MNAASNQTKQTSSGAGQGYRLRARLPALCYGLLKLSGWTVVTASCVIAGFALFFMMLGEFRFAGLVLQLDNFTSRFLAADGVRRAQFEWQLAATALILFTVVGFFRRHSLFPLFQPREEKQHG